MSVERVLAAAAALRDFTVDQLAAFCDEQPPAIVAILDGASDRVERSDDAADPSVARWRVVDLDGLRHDLAVRTEEAVHTEESQPGRAPAEPRHQDGAPSDSRLLLAEQTLSYCATAESVTERRMLVATAKNHLRQVVASIRPERGPWWSVELSLQRLGEVIERRPDRPEFTRLRLDVALACLAECDAAGDPVPARDLVDTVLRFQRFTTALEDAELRDLVGRFFDLVMAQLVLRDRSVPAPERLIAAVARRRARAQVEHGVGAAMHALVPLLKSLDEQPGAAQEQGLYQVLGHLPDGRDRVAVYSDLLRILPQQWRIWQDTTELLPGALAVVVAEPEAANHLAHCAATLESDLVRSPFSSDAALIGQVAHVFQHLADQVASLDGTVRVRSDQTRGELVKLAKAHVWTPGSTLPATPRGESP
ncbi:MAG: hypothetical protein ACRDTG_02490 [Pseudonocardiaceae bacterium]